MEQDESSHHSEWWRKLIPAISKVIVAVLARAAWCAVMWLLQHHPLDFF